MKNAKRKIHIDLTEETHKRLRIKAAIQDESIQKFVEELISMAVRDVAVENLQGNSSSLKTSKLLKTANR